MNSNNFFDLAINLILGFPTLMLVIMLVMCLIVGKWLAAVVLLLPIYAGVATIMWFNGYSLNKWIAGFFKKY